MSPLSISQLLDSADFAARVEALLSKWHTPGISVAISHNREVSSKGFGYANLHSKTPCTADTLFEIASSSKSLTAASVALLVADEAHPAIQWDAKMSSLLPSDFVMAEDSYTTDVTVEDILSHRSGIASHDDSYFTTDNARSVTRNLRNLTLEAPIRTKWIYCNIMFTVATHLVEQTSGLSFPDFLKQHFFQPLDMASTSLGPDDARAAGRGDRLAEGHFWNDKNESYVAIPAHEQRHAQGAGGIITSAKDYLRWVQALLHLDAPITEEIQRGLIKPRIFEDPDPEDNNRDPFTSWIGYGAGLESRFYRGVRVVVHEGLFDGFASCHMFLPDHDFGVVMLANSESAQHLTYVLEREFIDRVLNVPEEERPDWDTLATKRASDDEDDEDEDALELRRKLCPHFDGNPEPHIVPLESYVGQYKNAGYGSLQVIVIDSHLHIDAPDRSNPFTMEFEHIGGQTMFVAHTFNSRSGEEDQLGAEFRFDGERVVGLGVQFEENLKGAIWFDRVV